MAAIMLNSQVVTEAVASEVFDEIWLSELVVNASDPNNVCIYSRLSPARSNLDGTKTICREVSYSANVENFFSVATQDELMLMYQLVNMLKTRANC